MTPFPGERWEAKFSGFFFILTYLNCHLHLWQFLFNNKLIPSYRSVHIVFPPLPSFWFQEEWQDTVACAKLQDVSAHPLQGQVFASITFQIPGIPTAFPFNLVTKICIAFQGFLSCGRYLGVIWKIWGGTGFPFYLWFSHRHISFCMRIFLSNLWLPMACFLHIFMAESTFIVSLDVCFLIHSAVHGHRMWFCILLLWRVWLNLVDRLNFGK